MPGLIVHPPVLPSATALLLDLDGTLIDFAATPDAVVVPAGLADSLRRLRVRFGDALAIVTGRVIEQVDGLLGDIPYAVAGEHGGAIRHAPGAVVWRAANPPVPEAWIARAEALVARYPGALVERKARGIVLHFRRAPHAGPALQDFAAALVGDLPSHAVLAGAMIWEIRPRGIDKGSAVTALMAQAPFAGRIPVFVGDDVTDEDAMHVARAMGGLGLRVDDVFGTPAAVRNWLAREADAG